MSLLALVPDRVRPACAATEAPGLLEIGTLSSTRRKVPCDKRPGSNRAVLIGARDVAPRDVARRSWPGFQPAATNRARR